MSKNPRISSTSKGGAVHDRRREVAGVVGLGAALFLLIAMMSLQAGAMVLGPFGRSVAGFFYGIAAIRMLLDRDQALPPMIAIGAALGVLALATLVHLIAPHYRVAGHGPGGAIGEHLAE